LELAALRPIDDSHGRAVSGGQIEMVGRARRRGRLLGRKETSPDGETPGNQAGIFHRVRAAGSKVLEEGRDVIVDAMHLEEEHRLRQLSIAPPDIRYVIIGLVCTENLIRVEDVPESPILAERSGYSVSFWPSWFRRSSRRADLRQRMRRSDIN
jgi:hypothetical protein